MSKRAGFMMLYLCIGVSAWALDVETFSASSIDVSQSEVKLYSHERILLGLSCKSGPVGTLVGLQSISLGDRITHEHYAFRVGI